MDPTHPHLVHAPAHLFRLGIELSCGSYGQLPRSINSGFGLPPSSLDQSAVPNLHAEQPPWPQRILGEVRGLLLLLSPDGIVNYVSPSCKSISGFHAAQLEHNRLCRFIHDDDKAVFARELRECIATARPLRCHFRMYQVDNSTCVMEAHGHPHLSTVNIDGNQQQLCHGVFLVCRPYHTQSTQLLDSYLEHKLENIRLKERIAQLEKEEENDRNAAAQQSSKAPVSNPLGQSNFASSHESVLVSGEDNESSDPLGSIDDLDMNQTMAALNEEGMSYLNNIELLTGLFLSEGERAQGISTGIPEGHLYHFNDTNPPSAPSEKHVPPENEPRKRVKGEYQCTDCGTSDSPEWRKGPNGPKTLCNACGLRWAKRKKKRQDLG